LGRRGSAAPHYCREGRPYCPTTPRAGETSWRAAAASAAGVPPGRACHGPPRAGEPHGAAGGLLRGHVLACGPAAAVLRMRALACGPTAARFRAAALAYAPPAAAARLPTAARSAATLRPSASGAALGPHAPAVCLRHRARPSPLRRPRPVAAPTYGALRPASLPPIGSTPSAPAPAAQASP
jgi:hypothetical protein